LRDQVGDSGTWRRQGRATVQFFDEENIEHGCGKRN